MAVPFQIYLIQVEKQATYILKFPKNDGKRIHNLFEFVKSACKDQFTIAWKMYSVKQGRQCKEVLLKMIDFHQILLVADFNPFETY